MDNNSTNISDKYLTQYRESILKGISQTHDFCQNNEQFDQYTYIILWRPIEWIIDYAFLERFFKENENPTEDEITAFIRNYEDYNVDQKRDSVKYAVDPEGTFKILKKYLKEVNTLRRCRNATIYHYVKENDIDPFEYFDRICGAFVQQYCIDSTYSNISSPDRKIQLSELSSVYDLDIDKVYKRLKNLVNYLSVPEHNLVISICKMEEIAQLIAYKILTRNLHKTITYYHNREKGIFVSDKKVDSYIDGLTKELSKSASENPDYLSFKKIGQDLQQLRESRNMALHILEVTKQMETDFRTVWSLTINNYFGYDDRIRNLLEPELLNASFQKSLRNLSSYSEYYDNKRLHQIIISIEESVSLVIEASNSISEIYLRYSNQLNNMTKAESDGLYDQMSTEIINSIDQILEATDEETRAKYSELAKRKFGANYDSNRDTYHCLETALMLRDAVGTLSCDYAGICIELTRALEIYLFNKISHKLKEYLNEYPSMNITSKLRRNITHDIPTLGNYQYLYTDHEDNNSRDFLQFCTARSIYVDTDPETLKDELLYEMATIGKIADDYRNKIAHREMISRQVMLDCVNDILEGGGPIITNTNSNGSTDAAQNSEAFLKRISKKMGDNDPSLNQ